MKRLDEKEMLDLVAEGCTDKEIADKLGLKVRTVNFRMLLLYAKHDIPPGGNRRIKLVRKHLGA